MSFSIGTTGIPSLGLDYASAEALVSRAFSTWQTADCDGGFPSISLASLGPISCESIEYNPTGPNANAVIFVDKDWPYGFATLGLATVTFEPDSGKILGADIAVNMTAPLLTAEQVERIIAHEAGHFLGLDHSMNSSSLMYGSYSPFSPSGRPTLTDGDSAVICSAYPPMRSRSACNFEPEKGFAADCGGNVEGGCSFVPHSSASALAALLLWVVFGGLLRARRFCRGLRPPGVLL